jgi:hypothetical protein
MNLFKGSKIVNLRKEQEHRKCRREGEKRWTRETRSEGKRESIREIRRAGGDERKAAGEEIQGE